MSQGSKAGHLSHLPKIQLLLPYLTLNRLGFSESSKAGGRAYSTSLCNFLF